MLLFTGRHYSRAYWIRNILVEKGLIASLILIEEVGWKFTGRSNYFSCLIACLAEELHTASKNTQLYAPHFEFNLTYSTILNLKYFLMISFSIMMSLPSLFCLEGSHIVHFVKFCRHRKRTQLKPPPWLFTIYIYQCMYMEQGRSQMFSIDSFIFQYRIHHGIDIFITGMLLHHIHL